MQNKIGTIIIIIFFLTLLLYIKHSRKRLWAKGGRNSRIFTIRAVLLIIVILVFLFFSLVR